MMEYLIVYYLIINVVAFFTYGIDKGKAIRNAWRIPERVLILLAFVGGAVGAYLGMQFFHHKTKKTKFKIVYIFMIVQIILLFRVYMNQ